MNVKSNICRAVPLLVACLGLQAWTPALQAASPAGCQGCGVAVAPLTAATVVKSGTVVLFDVSVANAIPQACDIVNSTVTFYCPKADGTPDLANPIVLVPGTLNLPFGATATVATGIPCTITTTVGVTTAQAFATVTGPPGSCLKGANDVASGTGTTSLQVTHPCFQVTKNCPPNNACTPYGQPIQFSGSVINCGDEDIDVTLTDSPAATILPSATFTVLAGATVNYTGSYTPTANLCGPLSDTITLSGVSVLTGTILTPVTATANCPVCNVPCLSVTKNCADLTTQTIAAGKPYVISGSVSNCGTAQTGVPLINVSVVDHVVFTPVTGAPIIQDINLLTGGTIPVGGSLPLSATIEVPAGFCGTITDQFRATADSICPGVTVTPANSPTCTATIQCKPVIRILKEVACALDATTCGNFGPTATGTKGDTCPAFCWRITITNIDPTVPVGSVVVTDTLLGGDISSHFLGFPLAPGGTSVYTVPGQTLCDAQTVNSVTATPYFGANATGTVGDAVTSSATAFVKDIQLACNVSLQLADPAFDLDGNPTDNHVTLPAGSVGVQIPLYLQLINNGSADLIVRTVSDLPPLVTCDINETPLSEADIATALGLPISIPAGGSSQMTLVGCWIVGCPGGTISVSAHAEADDKNGTICVRDVTGAIVSVNTQQACPATVICEVPASCRVTGGGVLIPEETQTSECSASVVTSVQGPLCNLTEAVKITHGGQLGAPYANETCGNVALYPLTGDPCIRGQWEHVRHYQGKANPKSTVAVDNFHSNTPKGIFDMVKCACLPCCENPEAGGKIGNLCNPSDHKICGPMPRPAPANAIIFTGVGYMSSCATANAKGKGRVEPVVFRVYIEDRSEPGGQHPGGAKKPADIYCFQAWSLSSINGNANGKLDSAEAIAARQALADDSCNFIEHYTQGSLPDSSLLGTPVVNDCGALHTGNQQIHPSTSATCPDSVPVQ